MTHPPDVIDPTGFSNVPGGPHCPARTTSPALPLSNQRGNSLVSSQPAHHHLVRLTEFAPPVLLVDGFAPRTDTREMPAVRPAAHPEAAGTPCQCAAPEPCWTHDAAAAAGERVAPSVCQCIAPEPCRVHPDDRPWIKRPPAWVRPPASSTIGRLEQRPEPGGVQLEVEARCRLPKFTDDDVDLLVRLVSAEQRRRGLTGGGVG